MVGVVGVGIGGKIGARTDDRRTACKKIFGERQKMDHISYPYSIL